MLNRKQHLTNYLVVGLVIISSTKYTIVFVPTLLFISLSVFALIVVANKRGVNLINRKFLLLSLFIFVYFVFYILKFWQFFPLFFLALYLDILLAFFALSILNVKTFMSYLVNIVYKGAYISLPLFILQIINFDFTFSIVESIQNLTPLTARLPNKFANIIVWGLQSGGANQRNCGFMWEPGAFAAMLLLPIFYNFFTNNFKLDKKAIVMILALLSTISTMGYLGLLVILSYYVITRNIRYLFIIIPIAIPLFIFVMNLDFMTEKVKTEYDSREQTEQRGRSRDKSFNSYGRIGSLIVDVKDWSEEPLLGLGGLHGSINDLEGRVVNRTNGLSRVLLKYGLILFTLYFMNLYKSTKSIMNGNKLAGLFFVLLVLILSFSNEILMTPLFLSFVLISYVNKKRQNIVVE